GIMHALTAKMNGAKQVMLLEMSAERLEIAKKFNFDEYIQVDKEKSHHDAVFAATEGFGADVVIVACSVAAAQADALELAGKRGRIEFFGGLPKDNPFTTLNGNLIHYKELTISGSFSEKRCDFEAAQKLIMEGDFPAEELITHRIPLDDVCTAFEMMTSGTALKVCVNPNGAINSSENGAE
ncbi:MAG: zinc-binding dehydrogenase, partial [Planctomycetes bacterium]|nr:zinc-binding dehydrogenase [Planctomycetota bacterium]